jgi:anti-sigma regulatory factor (Ser/Thr protein kinase)
MLAFRVPPRPRFARVIRGRIADFARRSGIDERDLPEFLTAVGEAVANAIEHSGVNQSIDVECRAGHDRIVAVVRDAGAGFDAATVGNAMNDLPADEDERGRGLAIMQRCSDIFALESAPGVGTSVLVGRMIRQAAAR